MSFNKQSTSSPLDNRSHPMANVDQAPNLEGIHREMHSIAEHIKIMNELNARLVKHHAKNNPPPPTAPVPEDTDRSRRSHRLGDQDSHNRHSVGRGHLARSRQHQLASLHSR